MKTRTSLSSVKQQRFEIHDLSDQSDKLALEVLNQIKLNQKVNSTLKDKHLGSTNLGLDVLEKENFKMAPSNIKTDGLGREHVDVDLLDFARSGDADLSENTLISKTPLIESPRSVLAKIVTSELSANPKKSNTDISCINQSPDQLPDSTNQVDSVLADIASHSLNNCVAGSDSSMLVEIDAFSTVNNFCKDDHKADFKSSSAESFESTPSVQEADPSSQIRPDEQYEFDEIFNNFVNSSKPIKPFDAGKYMANSDLLLGDKVKDQVEISNVQNDSNRTKSDQASVLKDQQTYKSGQKSVSKTKSTSGALYSNSFKGVSKKRVGRRNTLGFDSKSNHKSPRLSLPKEKKPDNMRGWTYVSEDFIIESKLFPTLVDGTQKRKSLARDICLSENRNFGKIQSKEDCKSSRKKLFSDDSDNEDYDRKVRRRLSSRRASKSKWEGNEEDYFESDESGRGGTDHEMDTEAEISLKKTRPRYSNNRVIPNKGNGSNETELIQEANEDENSKSYGVSKLINATDHEMDVVNKKRPNQKIPNKATGSNETKNIQEKNKDENSSICEESQDNKVNHDKSATDSCRAKPKWVGWTIVDELPDSNYFEVEEVKGRRRASKPIVESPPQIEKEKTKYFRHKNCNQTNIEVKEVIPKRLEHCPEIVLRLGIPTIVITPPEEDLIAEAVEVIQAVENTEEISVGFYNKDNWYYSQDVKTLEPIILPAFEGVQKLTRSQLRKCDPALAEQIVKDKIVHPERKIVEKKPKKSKKIVDDGSFLNNVDYLAVDEDSTEVPKFASLSEYDDILTNLLLDNFYLGFTTHKMSPNFEEKYQLSSRKELNKDDFEDLREQMAAMIRTLTSGKKTADQLAELLTNYIFPEVGTRIDKNDAIQKAALLLRDCLRPNVVRNRLDFQSHAKRYINMYHPKAGYEIDRTFRYASTEKIEARLVATKRWETGDEIRHINGVISELNDEEEARLATRDFSIMYSSKRGCMCLFTGTARFMNHDCQPNCKFIPLNNNEITFKVIKPIEIGEELTCFYSSSYFGENNCECLCESCEKNSIGGFMDKTVPLGNINEYQLAKRAKRRRSDISYYKGYEGIDFDRGCSLEVLSSVDQNCCRVCHRYLEKHKTLPEFPFDGSMMMKLYCNRCYRHTLIFDTIWPSRQIKVKKSKGGNPKAKMYDWKKSAKRCDAKSLIETTRPVLVWIDPEDSKELIYWPAIVVPKNEISHYMPVPSYDEVLCGFFKTPLQYLCIKPAELFVFEENVEPMICFKQFSIFWEQREIEIALYFLKKGILPHRLQWEEFQFNPNEIVGFENKAEVLDDSNTTKNGKVSQVKTVSKEFTVEGKNETEAAGLLETREINTTALEES